MPKINYLKFSQNIKSQYPEYKDWNDLELAEYFVAQEPRYSQSVDFGDLKKKDQAAPSLGEPGGLPSQQPSVQPRKAREERFFGGTFGNLLDALDMPTPGVPGSGLGIGDFIDDMGRAFSSGKKAGVNISTSRPLFFSGPGSSDEEVQNFVKAGTEYTGPSDEATQFYKDYEDNGKTTFGFVKALAKNPGVAPELVVQSASQFLFNPEARAAFGASIAAGAGIGAVASAPLGGVGAAPGAIAAILPGVAAANTALSTLSSFSELMKQELDQRGLEFNEDNVRTILEDEKALRKIRAKSAGYGIAIGAFDLATAKVGGAIAAKIPMTTRAGKIKSTLATTGVEAVGGSAGEAAARGVTGQELDPAEIGLEGIAEIPGAAPTLLSQVLKRPTYKINGEFVGQADVDDILQNSSRQELENTKFEVFNDVNTYGEKFRNRLEDLGLLEEITEANPNASEADINRLFELNSKLKQVENLNSESAKASADWLRSQIREVQDGLLTQEFTPQEVQQVEEADPEAPQMAPAEVSPEVGMEVPQAEQAPQMAPLEDLEFDNIEFVEPIITPVETQLVGEKKSPLIKETFPAQEGVKRPRRKPGEVRTPLMEQVTEGGVFKAKVRDSRTGTEFIIEDPELSLDLAIAAQVKESGRTAFPQPAFLEAFNEVIDADPELQTLFPNISEKGQPLALEQKVVSLDGKKVTRNVAQRMQPIYGALEQRMENAEEIPMSEIESVVDQIIQAQQEIQGQEKTKTIRAANGVRQEFTPLNEEQKRIFNDFTESLVNKLLSYEFATTTTTGPATQKTTAAGLIATPREGRPIQESRVQREKLDGAEVTVEGRGRGRISIKPLPGLGERSVYGITFEEVGAQAPETISPTTRETGTTPAAVGVEPQTEQDVRQETNAPQEGRAQGENAAPVPQEEGRQEGQVTPPAVAQEGETPPATGKKPRKTEQQKADERNAAAEELKKTLRALRVKPGGGANIDLTFGIVPISKAVWNTAIDTAILAIDAGQSIAQAVKAASDYISSKVDGDWGKAKFGQYMEDLLAAAKGRITDTVTFIPLPEGLALVDGWYSNIEKKVREAKQDKQSASAWLNSGIIGKGDEATYTGVRGWLELKKPNEAVAKKEILDWMKDNRVEIVEVTKGEDAKGDSLLREAYLSRIDELNTNAYELEQQGKYAEAEEIQKEIDRLIAENYELNGPVQYSQYQPRYSGYQLEGEKGNYKELLVTLPQEDPFIISKLNVFDTLNWTKNTYGVKSAEYNSIKQVAINELEEKGLPYESSNALFDQYESSSPAFVSSHFEEPNILVHLRMNTRTDSDGNKVLFLEEIQSDWGQKGKREGFFTPEDRAKTDDFRKDRDRWNKLVDEISDERLRLKEDKEYRDIIKEFKSYGIYKWTGLEELGEKGPVYTNIEGAPKSKKDLIDKSNLPEGFKRAESRLNEATKSLKSLEQEKEAIEAKYGKSSNEFGDVVLKAPKYGAVPASPFVTDTNAWTKLAVKIAMREAAKQNVDKIAWTTGEQQNERYNLANVIDELTVKKREGTNAPFFQSPTLYEITSKYKTGEKTSGSYKAEELPDVVGKDLADKIISSGGGVYRGLDLQVGGKGMKGFYDKIVPDAFKSVVKELTGQDIDIRETEMQTKFVSKRPTLEEIVKAQDLAIEDGNSEASVYLSNQINRLERGDSTIETLFNPYRVGERIFDPADLVGKYLAQASERIKSTQQSIFLTPRLKGQVERGMPLFEGEKASVQQRAERVRGDITKATEALTQAQPDTKVEAGEDVARMASEMQSDQGFSDFTLRRIASEDYTRETASIDELRKNDPSLEEYIAAGEMRETAGTTAAVPPIVSSNGEVIDGYNRILQAVENGDKSIEVLKGRPKAQPEVSERGKGKSAEEIFNSSEIFEGQTPNQARLFFADALNDFKVPYLLGQPALDPRSDMTLTLNGAKFLLSENQRGPSNYVLIDDFLVNESLLGTGKGRDALVKLIEYADKNGITLVGEPLAMDGRRKSSRKGVGLSQKDLTDFYKRYGFAKISKESLSNVATAETGFFERKPQQQAQPEAKPAKTIAEQRKEFRETAKKYFDGLKKMGIAFDPEGNSKEDIAFLKALAKYIKLELDAGMVTFKGFLEKTANLIEGFNEKAVVAAAKEAWAKEVVKAYPKLYAKYNAAKRKELEREIKDIRKTMIRRIMDMTDPKIVNFKSQLKTEKRRLSKEAAAQLAAIRNAYDAKTMMAMEPQDLMELLNLTEGIYKEGRSEIKALNESLDEAAQIQGEQMLEAISSKNKRLDKLESKEVARRKLANKAGIVVAIKGDDRIIMREEKDLEALDGEGYTFLFLNTISDKAIEGNLFQNIARFFSENVRSLRENARDLRTGLELIKSGNKQSQDFINGLVEKMNKASVEKARKEQSWSKLLKEQRKAFFGSDLNFRYTNWMQGVPKMNGKPMILRNGGNEKIGGINNAKIVTLFRQIMDPTNLVKTKGVRKIDLSDESIRQIIDYMNLPENKAGKGFALSLNGFFEKVAMDTAATLEENGYNAKKLEPKRYNKEDFADDTFIGDIMNQLSETRTEGFIPYTPIQATESPDTVQGAQINEDDLLSSGDVQKNFSVISNNMITRKPGGVIVPTDIRQALNSYTAGMANMNAKLPILRDTQAIFSKKNLTAMSNAFAPQFAENLKSNYISFMTDRVTPVSSSKSSAAFKTWLMTSTAIPMFFNPKSALLQFLAVPNFMVSYDITRYLSASKKLISDPVLFKDLAVQIINLPTMRQRFGGRFSPDSRVVNEEMKRYGNLAITLPLTNLKISAKELLAKGYLPSSLGDIGTIAIGGAPVYYDILQRNKAKYLVQGMSEDQAGARAKSDAEEKLFEIIQETQQSSEAMYLSEFQKQSFTRLFTSFATATQQYYRKARRAAARMKNKEGNQLQNAYEVLHYTAINAMFFQFASSVFVDWISGPGEDELEEMSRQERMDLVRYMESVMETVAQGTGGIGVALQAIILASKEMAKSGKPEKALESVLRTMPAARIKYDAGLNALREWKRGDYVRAFTKGGEVANIPTDRIRSLAVQVSEALTENLEAQERIARITSFRTESWMREKREREIWNGVQSAVDKSTPAERQRAISNTKSAYRDLFQLYGKRYAEATTEAEKARVDSIASKELLNVYNHRQGGPELTEELQKLFNQSAEFNSLPKDMQKLKNMETNRKIGDVVEEVLSLEKKSEQKAMEYWSSLVNNGILSKNEIERVREEYNTRKGLQ